MNCTRGVKQGYVCTPVLFSLFINELAFEIINNGKHGVSFSSIFVDLVILLSADAIIQLSETVIGLQTKLNSLSHAASKLKLKVNMSNSSIMVFRKGGYLVSRERWFYDEVKMNVVNSYKYFGIDFTTKISLYQLCMSRSGQWRGKSSCRYRVK